MRKVLILTVCMWIAGCESRSIVKEILSSTFYIEKAVEQNQIDPKIADNFRKAKELIEKFDDVNAKDENGNTPLMFLAELMEFRGFREIQKDVVLDTEEFAEIVLKNGANVYIKNKKGDMALEKMLRNDLRGYWLI